MRIFEAKKCKQKIRKEEKMNEEPQENTMRPCPFRDFKSLIKHGLNDDKTPTASSVEQVSKLLKQTNKN